MLKIIRETDLTAKMKTAFAGNQIVFAIFIKFNLPRLSSVKFDNVDTGSVAVHRQITSLEENDVFYTYRTDCRPNEIHFRGRNKSNSLKWITFECASISIFILYIEASLFPFHCILR